IKVSIDARGRAIVIDDISKEVCEAFSKRSKQAEKQAKAFVARQGGDWKTMSADQKFKVLHQANLAYRAKKYTGSNDREIWREQAEELGWKHTTSLTDTVYATKTDAERFEEAYVIAARLVAEDFKSSAVLDLDVLRMHAAHGLIAAGIHEPGDMDHVRDMILQRGVVLEGERTPLVVQTLHGRERVTSQFQI
ncbi:relaxase domain-containing protein, partial [Acetobacter fabarum]